MLNFRFKTCILTHSLPPGCHNYDVLIDQALPVFIMDIVWRPWQSPSNSPIGHRMASLAKRFPLACLTSYGVVLGKAVPTCTAYCTSYDVLGKAVPTCLLDIVWRPWQSGSHLPIGHRMASSLAKRFLLAYWTSYGVLVKAVPICLLDIVWRPWQSGSHSPIGHRMASLANPFQLAYWTS